MNSQAWTESLPERLRSSVPVYLRLAIALTQNPVVYRALSLNSVKNRLLSATRLMARANSLTGLSRWGDPDIEQPLRVLLESIGEAPDLSLVGALAHRANLLRALCNRLYLTEALQRYPEMESESVCAPILVSGIARSGTTYLHRLMARHPNARSPKTFEVLFTRDPRRLGEKDERIAKTRSFLRKLRWCSPQVMQMHNMGCHEYEECYFWLEAAGLSWQYPMTGELPRFYRWLREQNLAPVYHHYAQQLRWLQWQSRQTQQVRQKSDDFWCLKSPFHLFGLEEMLRQFPDMQVVIIHRDPTDTLASWLALVGIIRHIHHRRVSYRNIGHEALGYWRHALEQLMQIGERNSERFVHVRYQDLITRPGELVESIFRACGRESDGVRAAVNGDGHQRSAGHKRRKQPYDIGWFGLSQSDVERSLGEYIDYTRSLSYCQP